MSAVSWLAEPTVTITPESTTIEQDVRVGGHVYWESIRVERVSAHVRVSSRGESADVPFHLLPLVIEAMQRYAS